MNRKDEAYRGFKVPEGYFEQLEERVLGHSDGEGNRGFRVPRGYFEEFDIQPDTSSTESGSIPINRNSRSRILWMAAAASILLFFGIKYLNTGQEQLQWSSLEQDEISLWIENDIGSMSSLDIAEAYPEVELAVTIPEETDLGEYLQQLDLDPILDEQ